MTTADVVVCVLIVVLVGVYVEFIQLFYRCTPVIIAHALHLGDCAR